MPARASWRWLVGTAVVCQAALGVPLLVCVWFCVPAMEWFAVLSIVTLLVALCALLGGLLVAPLRPGHGLRAAAWGAVGLCSWMAMTTAAGRVRRASLLAATERARPLIAAIDRFEQRRGAPPLALAALVPDYLPAVPDTGLPAYPQFEYARSAAPEGPTTPRWQLRLSCPLLMDADELVYWPGETYPAQRFGGAVSRLGGWALVRD